MDKADKVVITNLPGSVVTQTIAHPLVSFQV